MTMKLATKLVPAAALLVGSIALFPACNDTDPSPPGVEIGGDCLLDSDCASPHVCVFQRCHEECITSRDCDGSLRCVGAHETSHVCQLEHESRCATIADCAPGLTCERDGACRDVCAGDDECVGEQVCVEGACAESAELTSDGTLPHVLRATCQLSSDCPDGSMCAFGACVPECRVSRDCSSGQTCKDGICWSPPVDPCACHENIDCKTGEQCVDCACEPLPEPEPECTRASDCGDGRLCVDGDCKDGCVQPRDCSATQTCDGGFCVEKPVSTSVTDATLKNALDVAAMRGITNVEGTLRLYGEALVSTDGLERLQTVGRLELASLSLPPGMSHTDLLSGLATLKIVGDLVIEGQTFTTFTIPPQLEVGGTMRIDNTSITCAEVVAIQTQRPTLAVSAWQSGGCRGQCKAGTCILVP
jgi:hypothetical protein